MKALLLNAGSSSLKATLASLSDGVTVARVHADWAGAATHYLYLGPDGTRHESAPAWKGHADAVRKLLIDLETTPPAALTDRSQLAAVGHRFVHGGSFTQPVLVTPEVRKRINDLTDLAPLHNPPSLDTLTVAEAAVPDVPHIAVFDTAFHSTLPPHAYTFPVPKQWTDEWGVRRYGFHGLSHAYCAGRAAEMLKAAGGPNSDAPNLIICHLGHGCSASAVSDGVCIDTTMGFTPLEGLMMATRSGSIDPGLLLHMQQKHGMTAAQLERTLNRESGLLGVSGVSADMREVQNAARKGNTDAKLALRIYAHRVRQAIGAFAVTLGGVDALVFTAGVGEHSSVMRAAICDGLECLRLKLDADANENSQADTDIAAPESRGRILVIESREDVTILEEVRSVLKDSRS